MVSVDLIFQDNGLHVLCLFARRGISRAEGYIDMQDSYQIQFIALLELEVFILVKHGFH